jgi:hypothetical protein
MSKMNFEYMPQRPQARAEVRLPLLGLGYVILAASLAWMAAPLLMHG